MIDMNNTPKFPTDPDGSPEETFYNANPPSAPALDERERIEAHLAANPGPLSPSTSPSAYPAYTTPSVHVPTKTPDSLGGTSFPTDDKWKALPTQDDWESLGVGSTITRTAQGWDVVRKVTAGGGFAHGAGRSIRRAFQLIGASYDMTPEGKGKLVDAAGVPIPAEDETTPQ